MREVKLKCGCRFALHKAVGLWELLEACLDDSEQFDRVEEDSEVVKQNKVSSDSADDDDRSLEAWTKVILPDK